MIAPDFNIMAEFSRLLRGGPEQAPEESGGGWRAVYRLEPDFIGFRGHFPDYPLMPALMQVLMASHMLGLALGRELKAEALPTAKFIGQARPGDELVCLALPRAASADKRELWDISINLSKPEAGQGGGSDVKNVALFRLAFKA